MDITEHAPMDNDKEVKKDGTPAVSRTIHVMMCQEIGPAKKVALANGIVCHRRKDKARPDLMVGLAAGLHRHASHSCVFNIYLVISFI